MDNLSRHVALSLEFAEAKLEDGFHEVITLFSGEGSGHQGIFHCLHDGAVQTIPGVVPGNVLGTDCIYPSDCFGKKKLELVGLVSIGSNHGAQEFPGFGDFQSRDGCVDSVNATGQGEVAWGVRLITIAPLAIFPFEGDQAPVTFVVGQGSTCGMEGSLPIIQHGLHLGKDHQHQRCSLWVPHERVECR